MRRLASRNRPISRTLAEEIRPLVDGRPSDAFVFTSTDGATVDHAHFSERVWKPAVKKAKLTKKPTIHDMRHTYATFELLNGTDIHTLARQMGTSVNMLERHYSKLTATMAAEKLA